MIHDYWSVVTVYDDVVDIDLCNTVAMELTNTCELMTGIVLNTDPKDTVYDFFEALDPVPNHQNLINDLYEKSIIDDPQGQYAIRVHEMKEGGRMALHDDSKYQCSFSIYLSECIGGELQLISPSGNESLILSPIIGRCVKLQPDVPHAVHDVQKGTRISLQIFQQKIH